MGDAPRCARFYRGRDVGDWLADMGYYDMPVDQHPLREGVRDNTNHYVTGRDGGRDIDLRRFALEGMALHGVLDDYADGALRFRDNLRRSLDQADRTYNGINAAIDAYIAEAGIAAGQSAADQAVFNPAMLDQLKDIGGDEAAELVGSVVGLYVEQAPQVLSDIEAALAKYEEYKPRYIEFSPYNHVDGKDPPLLMTYPGDMTLPSKDAGHGIHHPVYGVKLKEKSDRVGHECHLLIPDVSKSDKYADANAFLFDKLLAK